MTEKQTQIAMAEAVLEPMDDHVNRNRVMQFMNMEKWYNG